MVNIFKGSVGTDHQESNQSQNQNSSKLSPSQSHNNYQGKWNNNYYKNVHQSLEEFRKNAEYCPGLWYYQCEPSGCTTRVRMKKHKTVGYISFQTTGDMKVVKG